MLYVIAFVSLIYHNSQADTPQCVQKKKKDKVIILKYLYEVYDLHSIDYPRVQRKLLSCSCMIHAQDTPLGSETGLTGDIWSKQYLKKKYKDSYF